LQNFVENKRKEDVVNLDEEVESSSNEECTNLSLFSINLMFMLHCRFEFYSLYLSYMADFLLKHIDEIDYGVASPVAVGYIWLHANLGTLLDLCLTSKLSRVC
jgi:hypothetical protein